MATKHEQHRWLVLNSSMPHTVQYWASFLRSDTVGVLGFPLPELLLNFASPNATTVLRSVGDGIAHACICLLAFLECARQRSCLNFLLSNSSRALLTYLALCFMWVINASKVDTLAVGVASSCATSSRPCCMYNAVLRCLCLLPLAFLKIKEKKSLHHEALQLCHEAWLMGGLR